LESRVKEGIDLIEMLKLAFTHEHHTEADNQYLKWDQYNEALLKKIFRGDYYTIKYTNKLLYASTSSTESKINVLIRKVRRKVTILEGIVSEVDLLEIKTEEPSFNTLFLNPDVFIVHGHDHGTRSTVARFVETFPNLKPIILDEQPNAGRTIIEKFEQESESAGFAIVIATPDDIGTAKSSSDLQSRARQNVIFELGYFAGRLGRDRVCVIKKGDVEIPSDLYGVLYIEFDEGDGWQLKLAKEMKAAGLDIDLNLLG